MDLSKYQTSFLNYLQKQSFREREPQNLYAPIDYILQSDGKRLRPILSLIASDVISGSFEKTLPVAMAIEMFHNFTLIHDDIMDKALLRRGKKTVYQKWNINTGILSGDVMLVLAYQYFENYKPIVFQKLIGLFSKTAIEVCDGQQLDIDFETRNNVIIDEYVKMITLKTSVLIGAALKMGAIVADANENQANSLYNFGLHLGIAFQLQDDYLDTFGSPETFGKQIGGDIIENKKTYLYLKCLEVADKESKEKLQSYYSQKLEDNSVKIIEVTRIFEQNNIPFLIQDLIKSYTNKSFECLRELDISDFAKKRLTKFGENLMMRKV